MNPWVKLRYVFAAALWVSVALGLYGQAQTAPAHCNADGPRDEEGRPHCCTDGSMPDGVNMCWCDPNIVLGQEYYRNPKQEYEVRLPEGVAQILGCSGIGHGFKVSLDQPQTGEGDYGMNQIAVLGAGQDKATFPEYVDAWRRFKMSSQKDGVPDEQLDEPEQTTLSSLPALHLKSVRTDPYFGKIVVESIVANNPHKNIRYSITLISPVDQYEKNQRLFKKLSDGFRYIPSGEGVSH